jgi:hypothetical protein
MTKAESKYSEKNERIQAGTVQGAKKERKMNTEKNIKKEGRMGGGRTRKVHSSLYVRQTNTDREVPRRR